mmetsp:Transcript_105789/g.207481  ORF Transcript_105789/g.207481 Transcript_105789/m.207481 type:complete len:188 (+) Transcript_105789:81-644(+)
MPTIASSAVTVAMPVPAHDIEDVAGSSDSDHAVVASRGLRSKRGVIISVMSVAAILGLAISLVGSAPHAFQAAPVEDLEAIAMKAPDEMFEFYAHGTPIDGSSHWVTCWHTGMETCSSNKHRCCCKAGWAFARPLPHSLVKVFSDGSGAAVSKELSDSVKSGALRQFYGECVKEEDVPPDALKAMKA